MLFEGVIGSSTGTQFHRVELLLANTLRTHNHWDIWMALQFGSWINPNVFKFLTLKSNPPALNFCGPKCKKKDGPVCEIIMYQSRSASSVLVQYNIDIFLYA